jgi:hypothetical protein
LNLHNSQKPGRFGAVRNFQIQFAQRNSCTLRNRSRSTGITGHDRRNTHNGKKSKSKGRPMSDSGTKARFYHAVKAAHMAHVIKVDLKAELFNYTIDEDKKRYLELLDGKLLLVTNTNATAAEVVQRYKSLADIERGFRVLKSDIEIGPVYHRLPQRIRAHALICFMALVLYRVMRMRLKAAKRSESPSTLLEQLKRIHQQTVETGEGKTLTGLTEITPAQKSLFAALDLTPPTPPDLAKPVL